MGDRRTVDRGLADRREAREKMFWEKREKIGTSG
jgi:hypothetical protein